MRICLVAMLGAEMSVVDYETISAAYICLQGPH